MTSPPLRSTSRWAAGRPRGACRKASRPEPSDPRPLDAGPPSRPTPCCSGPMFGEIHARRARGSRREARRLEPSSPLRLPPYPPIYRSDKTVSPRTLVLSPFWERFLPGGLGAPAGKPVAPSPRPHYSRDTHPPIYRSDKTVSPHTLVLWRFWERSMPGGLEAPREMPVTPSLGRGTVPKVPTKIFPRSSFRV